MLQVALGTMRDLPRLREITTVLIRHGLGDVVRRLGVSGVLERTGQVLQWGAAADVMQLDLPVRLRMALLALGPTFIKLGQVLATRVDLFPPDWIDELERLHSDVPPVPFDDLLPELTRALGRSPFEVFVDLDTSPQGSASIAQVHRAKLADGSPVVLKVRRPGIRPKVEADLRLLGHLAALIESELPEARRFQPVEIAAQFERSLARELDFTIEATNVDRFAAHFAGDPYIVIPRVYPQWTSETLLVQEHVSGIPGTDLAAVDAAGLDRRLLAARGAEALLRMILVDGFFHADPHPGNVFFLPGERIVLIDFGMVGRLAPRRRREVVDLLAGLAQMEEQPMLDVLLDWAGDAYVDDTRLAADINDLVFDYENVPLASIRIGVLLRRFADIVREHSIVLPADLTLMFKALITMEGLGRQFDPDFHIVPHLTPLLRKVLMQRYRPSELSRRGRSAAAEFLTVVGSVPRDIARLVREARRGKARIDLDLKRLDDFGRQLDQTLDRVTVGIMTASLVIGSAIIMTVKEGPTLFGVSVLGAIGFAGYLLAFVNSVWVIYGIWRSSRK
ncbi:MAG: ubiquinone biosynthesis protein UbiB [Burkholderiales bacterium]|nr:ubiquinone biosynthesis protein UbiB [Burkholderiales bacterium]